MPKKVELKPEQNTTEAAFTKGVSYVCRAPKTKKQAAEYLHKKGFNQEVIIATVEKMLEYGYINDEQFTELYVGYYGRTKGKRKLEQELKLKGVSSEIVENCELPDQKEAALNAAKRFMKSRENNLDNMQKLYRHLAGKGFEYSVCGEVVKLISNEEIETND